MRNKGEALRRERAIKQMNKPAKEALVSAQRRDSVNGQAIS